MTDSNAESMPKRLELCFRGEARDYFRIWLANIGLSLATLGLYSAWGSVRARQYFYSRTFLDGAPFRYEAAPTTFLAGRLTAFVAALFVASAYWIGGILLAVLPFALVITAIAAPWCVIGGAGFEATRLSYRGRRLVFHGTYATAARALIGAGILSATVVGLPWAFCRLASYLLCNTTYDGVPARFALRGERLFPTFLRAACLAFASIGATIALGALALRGRELIPLWLPIVLLPSHIGWLWASCVLQAHTTNSTWRSIRLGSFEFDARLCSRELFVLRLTNILAMIGSFGLLTPWAKVRLIRYRVERLDVFLVP